METGLSTQLVTYVEKLWVGDVVAVISWHCPPCHTAARRPARMIFHFWKLQRNKRTQQSPNCLSVYEVLSSGYCLTFIQSNILTIWTNNWFLAPVGHFWRRISSAACAMCLVCQEHMQCASQLMGTVIISSPPSHPFSLHTPQPRIGLGWKEALPWIALLLPVGEEGVHVHVTHYSVHVSEQGCDCSHFTVAKKRSSKLRWGVHRHLRAKAAFLSRLLCRARPVCERAAAHLHRSPGPGRCAWGDARGAFVCAFTAGLSSSISIWVRAHGAAPAGVGEVTLWGHTWTWPLHCSAPGTKPACVGRVPSCVTLWLSVAVMVAGGWHNNLFMLKRIVGGIAGDHWKHSSQEVVWLLFVPQGKVPRQSLSCLCCAGRSTSKAASRVKKCRALGVWVGEDLKKHSRKTPWYLCGKNVTKVLI